jgi:hypothetical protein
MLMTVTVAADAPADVVLLPTEALRDLGVGDEPEVTAAVASASRWRWHEVAAEDRDASVRLLVGALSVAWLSRRHPPPDDLRPSLRQVQVARQLVAAAGSHAAGLVAHVCAWVMPAEFGAPVPRVHSPEVCLGLFQAWCWPADEPLVSEAARSPRTAQPRLTAQLSAARQLLREHVQANAAAEHRPETESGSPQRRGEEAELVAWRLGTALQHVVWADGTRYQAEIAAGRAMFEAWRASLPTPAPQDLFDALVEAWHAWLRTGRAATGSQQDREKAAKSSGGSAGRGQTPTAPTHPTAPAEWPARSLRHSITHTVTHPVVDVCVTGCVTAAGDTTSVHIGPDGEDA